MNRVDFIGTHDGRPRYIERNKERGGAFEHVVPAQIVYCRGIEAWVFDLPHVVTLAGNYLKKFRAENVHLIPGDFFKDSFGEGYDLIISSSNPSGKSIELLPKISSALNNGGYFINVQSPGGLPDDPLQTLEYKLWTFQGVNKLHGGFTKEQAFMTPEYRDALTENNLIITGEQDIRDHYHRDTWVRMVTTRKK